MCTRDKEFTIRGIEDCLARGYDRTGFFEVDTTEQRSWTVQLTESTEQAPQQPLPQYTPLIRLGRPAAGPAEADQMRRLRRTKIVATLGPASSDQATIARLFEAGADVFRINMSHTSHDAMRKLHAAIRAVEKEFGRPIGILADLQGPKLRVGTFKDDAVDARRTARPSCSTTTRRRATRRACTCRIPEILAALEPGHTLLLDDGKVRLTATETSPKRAVTRVEVGGKLSARKGVSLPDTTIGFSALTEKDRSDLEACLDAGDRLGRRCRSSSAPRTSRRPRRSRAAAPSVMAKIEKPQAVDAACRDHGLHRRADGRARRSRRGDAAGKSARHPEADHPHGAPRRQAGGGRDADARIDDHQSGADARRGVRRRDRDLRRRRRRDAVGGIRRRAISGRGGRDHEPHRRGGRDRRDLPLHHPCAAHRAGSNRRRRDRRRGAPDRRDARSARDRVLDLSRARPRCASRASGRNRRSSRSRRTSRPAAGSRSSGACIASSPRTRATSTTWWTAPAGSRSAKASPRRGSASSSWPACRSARPARPTWCGSRSSGSETGGDCRRCAVRYPGPRPSRSGTSRSPAPSADAGSRRARGGTPRARACPR